MMNHRSRFRSLTAKVATVLYGLWAAFNVFRLIGIHDYALQVGTVPLSIWSLG